MAVKGGKMARWMSCMVRGMLVLCLMLGLPIGSAAAPKHDRAYYERRGDVVWEVPGPDKVIAITFDDGPDPEDTPKILDLLGQYGARATFFVVGQKVLQYPELARRQVAEGHELANHTFTHRFLTEGCTTEQIRQEIERTQQTIYAITGRTSRLFRPPGGMFDERVLAAAKGAHLQTVLWSWHQDTRDWARPGVNRIANKVLDNVRGGDIVLLHDYISGPTQTVAALELILPKLKEQGYRFVTVSELLAPLAPSQPVW